MSHYDSYDQFQSQGDTGAYGAQAGSQNSGYGSAAPFASTSERASCLTRLSHYDPLTGTSLKLVGGPLVLPQY